MGEQDIRKATALVLAASALAGCTQSADNKTMQSAVANTAAASTPAPTYCFFKDADTRDWSVATDAKGNVVVKGQAHIDDRRYMATFGHVETAADAAQLWLTMAPNTTGMGAQGNWWDISFTVPDSSSVRRVGLHCGKKSLGELTVKR